MPLLKSWPVILLVLCTAALAGWHANGRMESADRQVTPGAHSVVIYTMQSCPYCQRAIAYLDAVGQPYENKDVQRDPAAYQEYLGKTGGNAGVPVIDVDGKVIQGWNRNRLDQLLGLL